MSALHFRCQYLHNYITVTLHPFSTSLQELEDRPGAPGRQGRHQGPTLRHPAQRHALRDYTFLVNENLGWNVRKPQIGRAHV